MPQDLIIHTKSKGETTFKSPPLNELDLEGLRKHVKEASSAINTITISQAFALYKIMKSGIWQSAWGYMTWREYVEAEAGISRHRDERLRRMAKAYEFLKVTEEDLEDIGYSKAFILVALAGKKYNVLTSDNVAKWIKYAKLKSCTYRDFEYAIEEAKVTKANNPGITSIDPPKKLIKKTSASLTTEKKEDEGKEKEGEPKKVEAKTDGDDEGEETGFTVKGTDKTHEAVTVDDDEGGVSSAAAPTSTSGTSGGVYITDGDQPGGGVTIVDQVDWTTKLFPDQLKIVQAALDKAKQASGYDAQGMLLELVAAEYLAQAPVEFMAGDKYLQFLCDAMSKVHGVTFSYEKSPSKQAVAHEADPEVDEDEEGEVPF